MKKSNKKNILISGYYGFDNFGDEAILQTLVTKLKKSNCNITVLSSNPQKTSKNYDVDSIRSFNILKVVWNILKCNIFISGGGSLLQDVTSLKSLVYYLLLLNLALLSRKKVIIFAQGLGPFKNKRGAFWVKNTIKRCTYVSVRDKKSHYLLKKWGIKSDLVCDPFFDIPLPDANPQGIVGVQLRHTKTLNINYLKKLAQYICNNFKNEKIELYSFQDTLDLEVCKKFGEFLSENEIKYEIICGKTPLEIIEHISKLEYMVAMRFHAVLTAVRYGIKTLAISYDMKVEKFAEEFKIPCLNMRADDNFDKAFEALKQINTKNLFEQANEKKFNWQNLENIIG
ncbi:polysaccharide pyruvyl transferase CsaB [bacterium]|nr:polysaccharide pyruvyl transferase CsaB [bacterium]